ncbi:MAG TPA: alpha/beta hydrolase [Gemmataceae bacterium]|nr:alpha/beta hydrolase [Gemmataceae bacterium]
MFETLKKLRYGARVLLSRSGGQPETITVAGQATVIMHAGDGPPFVYLHSTLAESFMWFPFYQAWAKQFRVLVPTHPGFGQSGGFDRIDSIEDMAFHYVELFDALGLEEVALGGVSLGGWIAAEFAVRWPERVRRLWIADAPGLWVDEEPLPDLFRYMQDLDALRRLLFHDPDSHMARLIIKEDRQEAQMLSAYQSMTALARVVWDRPYDPKLPARLHRVRCPTLLLWGDHDRLVPPSYGEAYRKHLPQAELKLIANCGHLPMFEKEAEFVETVARFCRG